MSRTPAQQRYAERNREVLRSEALRRYHSKMATPEGRDRIRELDRAKYARNREKVLESRRSYQQANGVAISERRSKHYQKNKPSICLAVRKRKRGIKAIDELLLGEWESVVAACDNTCIVLGCGKSPVTMDHVIPLSKGGRHHISNLQPLCSFHNDSKGTKNTDYREMT